MKYDEFVEPVWTMPMDVSRELASIGESDTIAGMFLQAMVSGAEQVGAKLPSARERYTRFKFYPQLEFAHLLVEGAGVFYSGLPLRQALRNMGRSAPRAMIESTLGRVVLGSVEGVGNIIAAMAKTYPLNIKPCTVDVLDSGPDFLVVHLEQVGYFLDSHHLGVFEGALEYAGATGTVRVRLHSPTSADFLVQWGLT